MKSWVLAGSTSSLWNTQQVGGRDVKVFVLQLGEKGISPGCPEEPYVLSVAMLFLCCHPSSSSCMLMSGWWVDTLIHSSSPKGSGNLHSWNSHQYLFFLDFMWLPATMFSLWISLQTNCDPKPDEWSQTNLNLSVPLTFFSAMTSRKHLSFFNPPFASIKWVKIVSISLGCSEFSMK